MIPHILGSNLVICLITFFIIPFTYELITVSDEPSQRREEDHPKDRSQPAENTACETHSQREAGRWPKQRRARSPMRDAKGPLQSPFERRTANERKRVSRTGTDALFLIFSHHFSMSINQPFGERAMKLLHTTT